MLQDGAPSHISKMLWRNVIRETLSHKINTLKCRKKHFLPSVAIRSGDPADCGSTGRVSNTTERVSQTTQSKRAPNHSDSLRLTQTQQHPHQNPRGRRGRTTHRHLLQKKEGFSKQSIRNLLLKPCVLYSSQDTIHTESIIKARDI